MNLLEIPKFVINLDSRPDRMEVFRSEFELFFGKDQTFTRISAEYGAPVKYSIARSHKKAIRDALELGHPAVCIMEDDVKFPSKYAFDYAQMCFNRELPHDWDVMLGGTYKEEISGYRQRWVKLSDFSGLHFYIIHAGAYDTVLCMDDDMHIDRWIAQKSGLNCYRTRKIFALQHSGYSNNVNRFVSYDDLIDPADLLSSEIG